MLDPILLTSVADGVLTVTLNRPAARNALTPTLTGQLAATLRDADIDPGIRVVVLTGAGQGFCSGGDLRALDEPDGADPLASRLAGDPAWEGLELRAMRLARRAEAPRLLHEMGKPTIAAVNGAAVGAGLGLALACDFRIASETAVFGTEFARVGFSGDYGALYFLEKIVGTAKAREFALLGDRLSAVEAHKLGLVGTVVAPDGLADAVAALSMRLSGGAPVAQRLMKENLTAAARLPLRDYLTLESRNMVRSIFTNDAREGIAAFAEKRQPRFRGV